MKSNTQDCMNIIPEGVWRQLIRHKTGTARNVFRSNPFHCLSTDPTHCCAVEKYQKKLSSLTLLIISYGISTTFSRKPSIVGSLIIILLSVPKTMFGVNAEPPGFSLLCLATTKTSSFGFNISDISLISCKSSLSVISVVSDRY